MTPTEKLVIMFKLEGQVFNMEQSGRKLGAPISSVEYLRALDSFLRFQLSCGRVSPAEAVAVFNNKCHRDMGVYYRASHIMETFYKVAVINPSWLLEGGVE